MEENPRGGLGGVPPPPKVVTFRAASPGPLLALLWPNGRAATDQSGKLTFALPLLGLQLEARKATATQPEGIRRVAKSFPFP